MKNHRNGIGSARSDLLPQDIIKFRKMETAFLERCRQFGYQEIKTSTIEPLHIFMATGALAPELLRNVYSFLDWGGWSRERVALRADSTISAARYYLDNLKENSHVKVCYIENHFRRGDTGQDVSERWQLGMENIGDDSSLSDVEIIFIALDTLKAAGFDTTYLHLSFPLIIIESVNLAFIEKDRKKVLGLIKGKRYDDIKSLGEKDHNLDILFRLLQFKGTNASYLNNLKSDFDKSENIQQYLDRFREICILLDRLNCSYEINFSLSKNFDYYTGIQFEVLSVPQKRSDRDVLCAGGRYDNLISTLGGLNKEIPSVGFALNVKNVIDLMHTPQDSLQNIGIIIKNVNYQNIKTGQNLCNKLNRLGFISHLSFMEIRKDKYGDYGLIIEVDHEKFKDGYNVIESQKIGKPLLKNIFGESSYDE